MTNVDIIPTCLKSISDISVQLTHRHWLLAGTHAVAWRSAHHHNQKPTDGTRDWRMMCSVNDSLHHRKVKKLYEIQSKFMKVKDLNDSSNKLKYYGMVLMMMFHLAKHEIGAYQSLECSIVKFVHYLA